MPLTLEEISRSIGARVIGDAKTEVTSVASLRSATKDDLVFVEAREHLDAAISSNAGAVIAGESAGGARSAKPILIAREPKLAFTRAARLLHPPRRYPAGVHSTAVVHRSAKIAKHVSIGPNVVLGEDCTIGERSRIGPGCCIANKVEIGADCFIDNNVTIYSGTRIGKRVAVRSGTVLGSDGFGYVRDPATGHYEQFPQLGRLEIGDDVEIGANCTIDRGALDASIIGRGVKIDNLVHLAHNVEIGEDVVIAALTGISGSSVVERNVVVGGQVGIGDHARVTDGVILGSGSGVLTKKIVRGKGVVFWGRPARPLREYLRELAALGRLGKGQDSLP